MLTFSESAGADGVQPVPRARSLRCGRGSTTTPRSPGLCGFIDAAPGDGQVVVQVPTHGIPDDSYVLAVARSAAGESKYGSDGRNRDPAGPQRLSLRGLPMRSVVRVLSTLLTVACLATAARASLVLQPRSRRPAGAGRRWPEAAVPDGVALAARRLRHGLRPGERGRRFFGGYDDEPYLDETWTFDGTTWTEQTPALSPLPRAAASMAYDPSRAAVLWRVRRQRLPGDTWLWNGANGSWEHVATATSAPA